jgi:hypothetical protein
MWLTQPHAKFFATATIRNDYARTRSFGHGGVQPKRAMQKLVMTKRWFGR